MISYTNEQLADFFVERLLSANSPRDAKTRRLRKFLKKHSSLTTRMRFLSVKVHDSKDLRAAMLETAKNITEPVHCDGYSELLANAATALGMRDSAIAACETVQDLELELLVAAEETRFYQKEKPAPPSESATGHHDEDAQEQQGDDTDKDKEFGIGCLVILIPALIWWVWDLKALILSLIIVLSGCLAYRSGWFSKLRNAEQETFSSASPEEFKHELVTRAVELARARMDCQ